MTPLDSTTEVRRRADGCIQRWGIEVDRTIATETSWLAFGRAANREVVLKVARRNVDEWETGAVTDAFAGAGVVRVYARDEGAVLLERLQPGHSLADALDSLGDDEAVDVLAGVIKSLSPPVTVDRVPTVATWGRAFDWVLRDGSEAIPRDLVENAAATFAHLEDTQSDTRLLHGDLHHFNVLHDVERGWIAIDPKGVIGEIEYEVGAALRNPYTRPDLILSEGTIARRIDRFATALSVEATRITGWGFAQAVLAAVWSLEDGAAVPPNHPHLTLARTLRRWL